MDNVQELQQIEPPRKGWWIFKSKELRELARTEKEAKKQARMATSQTQSKALTKPQERSVSVAEDMYELPSATQQNTTARQYWDTLMQNHPGLHFVLSVIGSVVEFFFGGHFVVWAGRKVVLFSGRTAESALLFAALWISAIYSAHDFMVKVSFGWAETFTNVSILSFTLLPEIVLFSAIITCVIHWYSAIAHKKKSEYVWAVLYSLPTIVFFGLAIFTFTAVIESQNHTIPMAQGWSLVTRAVTSWIFALIGMVHAGLKKRFPHMSVATILATPVATVAPTQTIVEGTTTETQVTKAKLALPRVQRSSALLNLNMLGATEEDTIYENWPAVSEPESVQERDTGELEKVATTVDTILDTEEATNTDPELATPVATQKATSKVTKKLPPLSEVMATEEDTKPAQKVATQRAQKRDTKSTSSTARDRAINVLKKHQDIGPTELAKKAKISTSYAKLILREQTA